MPPRKPPRLDPGLFAPGGLLSPGSAKPARPASSIHPDYIIDAHSFAPAPAGGSAGGSAETGPQNDLFGGLPESYTRPPVRNVVQVKMDVGAEPASSLHGVKPISIHPTILNLTPATTPSITNIAKGAVDIVVPSISALTEAEWELLEEAISSLADTPGGAEQGGKVVISGILPPPLSKVSGSLPRDEGYQTFLARIANLSLNAHVYLKALPPVVASTSAAEGHSWWTDDKELSSVVKMCLSPVIEAFGTHRIIFGSHPAVQASDVSDGSGLIRPISPSNWYGFLRQCVSELGEGQEAMTAIMGGNAANVYELA